MTAAAAHGDLVRSLRDFGAGEARIALVLGSGLGAFADRLASARSIACGDLPGMPHGRVAGHAGRLVLGEIDGVRVLVQQGRVHLYEGWSATDVARAVRAYCALGVRAVVLTNASGGLRPEWPAGTLVRITDHINLQGHTPLESGEAGSANPHDPELGEALDAAAAETGLALERGVYAALLGPSYETPAEIRLLRDLGADAVGMSTACEALAAFAAGARVAAVSLITNQAAGISPAPLAHSEVLEAGARADGRFSSLLAAAMPRIAKIMEAKGP